MARGFVSGKGAGFALSVVVIILYRVVFVTSTNQALNGRIPAQLGPWIANAIVLLWALVSMLVTVVKGAGKFGMRWYITG